MPVTQAGRNVAIGTILGPDKLLIRSATVTEQLGRLFQIDVTMSSADTGIAFSDIVGTNATIRLELPKSKTPRYFNGFVSRFQQTDTSNTGAVYSATLVPWLWFLTRTSDCRIFQNKSVPDIVKEIFRQHGFTDIKDALSATYSPWENCVQYRETDFSFVSRLMEHEGIYYFFEHGNGKHTLVLADAASAHKAYPGYESIPFRAAQTGQSQAEAIDTWSMDTELQPGTYSLNDFNFENPKTSLVSQSNIPTQNTLSDFPIYDYPGEYGEQSDGSDYAKIRIEELHSRYETVRGAGRVRGIANGCIFTMTGAPRRDQNRTYLVTASTHNLAADNYTGSGGDGRDLCAVSFTAIDARGPFRTARVTPKPLIQGPQTAIVVGPSGEEIHTDKYGRIKVQFHWDRYGKADENSSCWVRVSQAMWAGKKWGSMHIPRVGQEVIVNFLEGDPDLPIVTGQVYNADCMPPYDLPAHKTRTTLKSNSSKGGGGFNELRFEDKKGSEQIFIHGENRMDVRVKASSFESVGGERHLTIEEDQFEKVKGDKHQEVVGEHNTKTGENFSLDVGQNIQEKAGMNVGIEGGMEIHLKGGMTVIIEAGMQLSLKAAGSFIDIGPAGVAISGPMLLLNSGGAAGSGQDISPTAPKPAKEADDARPGSTGSPSAKPAATKPAALGSVRVSAISGDDSAPAEPSAQAQALQNAESAALPFVKNCPGLPSVDPNPPPDPIVNQTQEPPSGDAIYNDGNGSGSSSMETTGTASPEAVGSDAE